MARSLKKNTRNMHDLPGLFDNPSANDDVYFEIISKSRKDQTTPRHAMHQDEIIKHSLACVARENELQFISFGSGSSGNCAYIGVRGKGGVLVDAGIGTEIVEKELKANYILPEKIAGIILTHDHNDHVRYAYTMLRKHKWMRVFCTPRTLNGLLRRHSISSRIKEYHSPIFKEFEFDCGPFKITPFEVTHDGSDNVGFSISIDGSHNFVVATDMGEITPRADHYIRQADFLMIESNYDDHMLTTGRYAEYLKARIRSARGHLDNKVTAGYLASIYTERLKNVYLCHLSHDNNTPQLAVDAVSNALADIGLTVGDGSGSAEALKADIQLYPLPRYVSSPLFIHRL